MLQPTVLKKRVGLQDVPEEIRHLADGKPCYMVTISPQRDPKNRGVQRVKILMPRSMAYGYLVMENRGRIGDLPAANKDDLRPILFYVFGCGIVSFKVIDVDNHSNYGVGSLEF